MENQRFEINRKTTGRYISGKYPHQRHFTGRDKYGFFIWKDGNRISRAVFIWISLKENIIMGRNVKDSDYEAILKKLNLGYLLERFSDVELDTEMVAKLSGGEKQRIALARAMVGKPQVYLLDEITSSLDEQNAREMEEILLAEDAMVLYVCHKIIPELKGQYEMLTF